MSHLIDPPWLTAWATTERPTGTVPGASSKGGDWRFNPAEMPSPEASPLGPFATTPSPVLPVESPWLLTPAASERGSSGNFCTGADPHR
jgi:hypothetical protein